MANEEKSIKDILKEAGVLSGRKDPFINGERFEEYDKAVEKYNEISDKIKESERELDEIVRDLKLVEEFKKSGMGNDPEVLAKEQEAMAKQEIVQKRLNSLKKEEYITDENCNKIYKSISSELEYQNKKKEEGLTLEEKVNHFLKEREEEMGINSKMMSNGISEIKKSFLGLKSIAEDFLDTWGKIDQAAFDYAKHIGGNAQSSTNMRKNAINFVQDQHIGQKYNTSAEELIKMQEKYNTSIGRTVRLTNDQMEGMAAMKQVMGEDTTNQFTTSLEKFGLDTTAAEKKAGEMFSEASKHGVVFEQYSKNFLDNIKLAQNYTFTNGIKGLQSMAEKSTVLKLNMSQVAQFADKVSTVEGSIQTAAGLSVLGGSFAQFSNPMAMLNEGLNDMEGLHDRIVNMFGNLGRWNSEKGMVDVSSFNKARMRAAAQATGMNYSELMDMVQAKGRRNEVERQMNTAGMNAGLSEDTKELILNQAQIDKDGKAYVNVGGVNKSLNEITESDQEELKKNNQSDSDNIREIATDLRGWNDIKEGFKKQFDNTKATFVEWTGMGETAKTILNNVGSNNELLGAILGVTKGIAATMLIGGIANGFGNIFGSFGKGGTGSPKPVGGGPRIGNGTVTGIGGMGKASTFTSNGAVRSSTYALLRNKEVGVRTSKALSRGAGFLGSTAGGGILGGGFSAADEFLNHKDDHTGTEKGSRIAGATIGGAAGMAAGAAIGGAIGSAVPIPIVGTLAGMAIGGLIGWGGEELGGLIGDKLASKEEIMEMAKHYHLDSLKGFEQNAYDPSDVRAMISGDIDRDLSHRMSLIGDDIRYNAIKGNIPQEKFGTVPKYANGGVSIARGKSHAEGGILTSIGGKLSEIEGNEAVISATKTNMYRNELSAINNGTLPHIKSGKLDMYKNGGVIEKSKKDTLNTMDVSENVGYKSNKVGYNGPSKISFEPLDIKFNGTLKLDLGKQSANINIESLLGNPKFKNEIAKVVMKEVANAEHKGNIKENTFHSQFANRH